MFDWVLNTPFILELQKFSELSETDFFASLNRASDVKTSNLY